MAVCTELAIQPSSAVLIFAATALTFKHYQFWHPVARLLQDGDTVTVDMTGRLAGKNGLYFIKTTEADGEPITLRLGPGLIPGLREGIEGMKLQEIRRIVVPEELGYTEPLTFPGPQPDPERTDYRERLQSVVNSNSRDGTLVFDVKVVNIR